MIAEFFGWAEGYLTSWFQAAHAPEWLHGILILGLFRGIGAVISVMLPPMAIFSYVRTIRKLWILTTRCV